MRQKNASVKYPLEAPLALTCLRVRDAHLPTTAYFSKKILTEILIFPSDSLHSGKRLLLHGTGQVGWW